MPSGTYDPEHVATSSLKPEKSPELTIEPLAEAPSGRDVWNAATVGRYLVNAVRQDDGRVAVTFCDVPISRDQALAMPGMYGRQTFKCADPGRLATCRRGWST